MTRTVVVARQVRAEAQRVAVLAATMAGPAPVLALLPRTLNSKLLQQLTEDIGARRVPLAATRLPSPSSSVAPHALCCASYRLSIAVITMWRRYPVPQCNADLHRRKLISPNSAARSFFQVKPLCNRQQPSHSRSHLQLP